MSTSNLIRAGLVLALAVPGPRAAQESEPLTKAREVVRRLQDVDSPEESRQSIVKLEATLAQTEDADAKALYLYTLGWLSERAGEGGLESAQKYYVAMLALKPTNVRASLDLARVRARLGNVDKALAGLGAVLGTHSPDYLWSAGDLLAGAGRWPEALQNYSKACLAEPRDERDAWRVVGQLPAIPDEQAGQLLQLCDDLAQAGIVGVALEGWIELAARRSHGDALAPLADRALALWAETQARRNALDGITVARLPQDHPGTPALRVLTRERPDHIEGEDFWRTKDRVPAYFEVLRARARAEERAQRPEAAEQLYGRATEFGDFSNDARLTIRLDRALLYHVHSQLPQADEKFATIEAELFEIKGRAYLGGDLPTIEHSHRTLAWIYLERGTFDSGLRGAQYHVESAIETACARAKRSPEDYAPYPELSSRLAQGLGGGKAAVDSYLRAARGYLEVDDLEQAAKALSGASSAGAQTLSDRQPLYVELGNTLKLRNASRSGPLDSIAVAFAQGDNPLAEGPRLAPTFVERQRIRALADASKRFASKGDLEQGKQYFALALSDFARTSGATWREVSALGSGELVWAANMDHEAPTLFLDKQSLPQKPEQWGACATWLKPGGIKPKIPK